jgi:EAL domain-containing protein (putative c-di-GMP-specific phosphodiesterase class I)
VATVTGALAAHDLPADALILELTESLLMDDPTSAVEILGRLRTMGARLAIDDFGTGYSSLAYLKRFPVDVVKIDRTFIEALDREDTSEETLVAAIIAMTTALRLTTIGEGVERVEQADRLRRLGCTAAQGYLFSFPLDAVAATEFLQPDRRQIDPRAGSPSSWPTRDAYRANDAASGPDTAASSSDSSNSRPCMAPSSSASR